MNLEREIELTKKGYKKIFGVDEVGRGPLAGPIVVCFYSFDQKNDIIDKVKDSKKVSERTRDKIVEEIKIKSLEYSIGAANNLEIDKYGIMEANRLAIERAYKKLKNKPDYLILDYTTCDVTFLETKYEKIEKGDNLIYSIASASIIAKVFRDNLMKNVSKFFEEYDFEKNKGYGTSDHIKKITKNNISSFHRKSFCKNFINKN